jgi:hypothetical protein
MTNTQTGSLLYPTTDYNDEQMEDGRWKCGSIRGHGTIGELSYYESVLLVN